MAGGTGERAGDVDLAVAELARRFRAALDPPARAGAAAAPAEMRERLAEPLPARGCARGARRARVAGARRDDGRPLLRLRHRWCASRRGDRPGLGRGGRPEPRRLHFSDYKALRTLGLGAPAVRTVAIHGAYRLRMDELARAIQRDRAAGVLPAIVIAQAGSVNTGASDPLAEIASLCADEGPWLHVDGAFGAFFRLCERTVPLVAGLERADSLAVDGHKWLNVPSGIGFAFVRDRELHLEAFADGEPAYLTQDDDASLDERRLGIEASRGWPPGLAEGPELDDLNREVQRRIAGGGEV